MNKFIKENWFVVLIALFLVSITVYFTYDQNKDKLPGKKTGGKDVVFSVDNTNYTADELYDELYKDYGESDIYLAFQRAILDEKVPTTSEMKNDVQAQVDSTVAYYQQNYGYGEDYLNQIVRMYYGYSSYYDYVLYSSKSNQMFAEYIKNHLDEVYTSELQTKLNGRIVSYVVLTADDIHNLTAEESATLKEAQEAWASAEYSADNFGDFATKYSQDSGANKQGKFGYIDSTTSNIDEAFKATALSLKEGEVSDWIESEQFGYFLIKCDSTNTADLVEEDNFAAAVLANTENLSSNIIWSTAQELGVKFGNDEIEKLVKTNLGITD